MDVSLQAHQQFIAMLERCVELEEAEREAIRALPFEMRHYEPSAYLVREGQLPRHCALLIGGFTFRQKLTAGGDRTICSVNIPGDFVDLQNVYLTQSDHNVQALTPALVAEFQIPLLRRLIDTNPGVARAMWVNALVEASIFREWLLNVGRRHARARLVHLLCEVSTRLRVAGIPEDRAAELPMTQEQLGDALGLTAVHINRVLKNLEDAGIIVRRKRQIRIVDWEGALAAAHFNDRYLHLRQRGR